MIQSMYMAWGFRVPVYPKISASIHCHGSAQQLTRNPYAAGLAIDGEDGGTGAAYNVSMDHMGHPIATNIRDCLPEPGGPGGHAERDSPCLPAAGSARTATWRPMPRHMIMLGASGVQTGKYIMQAAAGCLGSQSDRCNICNIGRLPQGHHLSGSPPLPAAGCGSRWPNGWWTCILSFRHGTEKNRMAPLGRSTALPIGMSDALGISDYQAAQRLNIKYVI
jgi:glutamate synthase (NADPH/NADH) large chain